MKWPHKCSGWEASEEDPSFCANCGNIASAHKGPTPGAPRSFMLAVPVKPSPAPEKKQPTKDGYWWTRPAPDCLWRVVEIRNHDGRCYIEEMGEDGRDLLPACPWWEWVGPIAPPKS